MTMSYYASNSLLHNTSFTCIPYYTNPQLIYSEVFLQDWLNNSYNAQLRTNDDISDLLGSLKYNSNFNPFDSIDEYISGLEDSPLCNMVNNAGDKDYYMYTKDAFFGSNYSSIKFGSDDTISSNDITINYPYNYTVWQEAENYITSGGQINGVTVNTADAGQLKVMYKKLVSEMQGLKEYTLKTEDIYEIQNEIYTLNGAGVRCAVENKILTALKELKEIFQYQVKNMQSLIDDPGGQAAEGLFDKTEIDTAVAAGLDGIAEKLFGFDDGTEKYNLTDNPYYKYVVSLRTNPDLEFETLFNETVPEWNTSTADIPKEGVVPNFDPANYTNIEQGDEKLNPIDLLKDLYANQRLLELFKQFEEIENKSNSMLLSLNIAVVNSAEFDIRKGLAAAVLERLESLDPLARLEISGEVQIAQNLQRGSSIASAATSLNTAYTDFTGFYGEKHECSGDPIYDPYTVTINGIKYILGQDQNSNENIDDISEIFGINDSIDNPFESLISLDMNNDGIVSKEELNANNIILKAIHDSGKLTESSFDTDLIRSIDLSQIDKTLNGNSAGTFSMKLANGSTVKGEQTFDDQEYFNNLFGKLVDLTPYKNAINTKEALESDDSESEDAEIENQTEETAQKASSTNNLSHKVLLDKLNKVYSNLIIDDTSNIENILNNICWKRGISLTPAQSIKIIDSVEPLSSVYETEKQILSTISKLNLSA